MKLVIIEGAGKKETIEKYLGQGYRVFATKGHVRDLPEKTLGVDVKNNFAPKYEIMPDKKDVVSDLKAKAAKADGVLLATDPDREGEAISWHLCNILGIENASPCRIVFNEISKNAVQNALAQPRAVDVNLVNAQQARRVVDRLVGYKLSPLLCRKIAKNLSGGRVQSVTLKLVTDREREIANFKPEEYWTLSAFLNKIEGADRDVIFKANLFFKDGKKIKVTSRAQMDEVLGGLDGAAYSVKSVKRSVTKTHAPAPFITSTMQQDALNKLGFNLKQTQSVAQELYEGVALGGEGKTALVTYIRTDSTRVSSDAQNAALAFIRAKFGPRYAPDKPNFYASKKGAQDAHEAIRPISVERTPDSVRPLVGPAQYKLYKLIYDRFLASQMSEAQYNVLTVDVGAAAYAFRASGRALLFEGYTAAYTAYSAPKAEGGGDEDEADDGARIPDLAEGDALNLNRLDPQQKFTKPPPRYTEATLIKTMEEKGIGRPATFTPTVATLFARKYVEREGRFVKPTELAYTVTDLLVKYFTDVMDIGFTAGMETELDGIEDGGKVWQNVVGDFYKGFEEELMKAMGDDYTLKKEPEPTDIKCDKCGAPMVIREGRFGKFLSCSAFPKCRNLKNLDADGNVKPDRAAPVETDVKCSKCGAPMAVREGRFGKFLSCTAYPKCRSILPYNDPNEVVPKCPECGRDMVKRRSKRGNPFWGCSGYPECKHLIDIKDGQQAESRE
jgi:DNA topoisomerase-1